MEESKTICSVCGKTFPTEYVKGTLKKYDTDECRIKANNAKKREETQQLTDAKQYIVKLEQQLQYQEYRTGFEQERASEAYHDYERLKTEVDHVVEDMKLMFELGVLGINKNSVNYPLLQDHNSFLMLVSKYQDNRDPVVVAEEKLYRDMCKRHRYERVQAQQQDHDLTWMVEMDRRQNQERRDMSKRCRHYWAWYEIEDRKSQAREDYNIELSNNDPSLQQFFDILNDVTASDIQE